MARVLLVEDDDAIRGTLAHSLSELGHEVTPVATGADAIASFTSEPPEVLVLDLGLPDTDGANVLAMSRVIDAVPVIVATARDDDRDVVRLLDAGADDYLIKPFSAAQMDARIRAVLRRTHGNGNGAGGSAAEVDETIAVGALRLDPLRHTVHLDGDELDLSRKEFDLLHVLMRHPGQVVTKQDLLSEVWQLPWGSADRTVDVHLSWLRRKLGETAAEPRFLLTVRGVGIKLVDPDRS
ncbi:response regulator transcription factor [Nocardioides sp.]|uniref:response regulator transcription factor n=1 Tax=Nocardioides sp. TaxID=35761 RepID=UPI002629C212|nr:response regulator transcription factor [Nocardioides sp.]